MVRGRHALGEAAGSLAFYSSDLLPELRDDALVASPAGRHLLRLRFADADPTRIASAEPLLQDQVGAIRVVTIGPDGAIYFCTADSLGRLVPNVAVSVHDVCVDTPRNHRPRRRQPRLRGAAGVRPGTCP